MSIIIIPARYESSRFPGKPLALINNKPMVIHVYERAIHSKLAQKCIIATDDERIFDCAKKFNANVIMTSKHHKSGTDRVYEVAEKFNYDIIINLQGDEPLINPDLIDSTIETLENDKQADIATPITPINNKEDIENPNIVKVVFNKNNYALYFSRSKIPFVREEHYNKVTYYKHIGLYGYRKRALERFVNLEESNLEKLEKLEQLRALENNIKIKIFITNYNSIGVDTPSDLKKIIELLNNK